jgi:hypothetical protein
MRERAIADVEALERRQWKARLVEAARLSVRFWSK